MANKGTKGTVKITTIVTQLVDLLTPLSADDRRKVISAASTLLGDAPVDFNGKGSSGDFADAGGDQLLNARTRTWAKQNSVTMSELENVFHFDDTGVTLIATTIPGSNEKARTQNAYILTALGQFLLNGTAHIEDKAARAVCVSSGCYDSTNHAKYLSGHGNELTGSKEKGWTLTTPGLTHAARLVKEINGNNK